MFSPAVGREGHCKQITLACAHNVSTTLGQPLLMGCVPSLPTMLRLRLLHGELSEVSPGLHATPKSKLLRFRQSGSPQRHSWACVLCPSQVRAAQVARCSVSTVAVTYLLPVTRFSGCTISAPSQVDIDCPEPQEVLVSKEACLKFGG